MFCYIFRKSNLSDQLGLTEHMKHLQCRSTEEIWNVDRISSLPSIINALHCEDSYGMIWNSADLT